MDLSINELLTPWIVFTGGVLTGSALLWIRTRKKNNASINRSLTLVRQQLAREEHLCTSALEALAYAIDASDTYNFGHIDCVQRASSAMAKMMHLPEDETAGLHFAALLHNVGRLGVPEYILRKPSSLTPEEQEKLQTHPVLGARILASIPFPVSVVPLVRHHCEHWDGNGYPDGLKGTAIPLGARILSVANAYSALLRPRPWRAAYPPDQAIAIIEDLSGTRFDPAVVAAFRMVAAQLREEFDNQLGLSYASRPNIIKNSEGGVDTSLESAAQDIASAKRETLALEKLTYLVADSLHMDEFTTKLVENILEIVPCSACVIYLPQDDKILHAVNAKGINERHLLESVADIGNYLTGRVYSRGESIMASFLPQDIELRPVGDPWIEFKSSFIVPIVHNGIPLGTINLYSEQETAFNADSVRVMRLVAAQAGRGIHNASNFAKVQETAYTDALTGLKNARFLREFMEKEINRAKRDEFPLAVLNIDLDNFKPINDQFGHARGDQTLKEMAEIFNAHIRNYDLAARYAGDEFVIVLARSARIQAEVVAGKLKASVDKLSRSICAKEPDFPRLGVSIGIAIYPDDAEDVQGMLCRSDTAMYEDKIDRKSTRKTMPDERHAA